MDLDDGLTYGAIGLAAAIAPVCWWVATSVGGSAAMITAAGLGGAIALLVLLWWWMKRRRSASYGSYPLNYSSSGSGSSRSTGSNRAIDTLPLNQDRVIEAVGEAAEIVVNEAIEELAEIASQQIQDWVEQKTAEPEPIAAESGNFETIFEAAESAADSSGAIESGSSSDYSSSDSGSDSSWSSSDSSSDY
ncbi:MAG TPA: hypothetical protein V6D46_06085, partial [Coleofasciculaceae cyanobacterium]